MIEQKEIMNYKWEEESLKKYGEEITSRLVKEQKEYELKKGENNCSGCGSKNEGAIIEFKDGTPFIMRYGLWSNGRCNYCGRRE